MGCVASKFEEDEEVVSICRERKRLVKLALQRRYDLADAHFKYCRALYGVSAAISLFVARHSSPSSPFLITLPPPCPLSPPKENEVCSQSFLQQTPSGPTQEAIDCGSCHISASSSDSSEEEREEEKVDREEQQACGYFYMDVPASMPSSQRDFGWDFFNLFTGVRPEIISGYNRNSDDDLRVVREEEGIPELEEDRDRIEEEQKMVGVQEKECVKFEESGSEVVRAATGNANATQREQKKGLSVIDTPVRGRELLEALKDIEDHFIRAYDSGKDVCRMLEADMVHLQSGLEEIKENSTKLIQAIAWRSTSSRSTSCKSLVASSSKTSSTWTEFKNDLFDAYGGMDAGCHSLTLGRLYAWEKKLYDEVKDGDGIRKLYERKCNQLRNRDARGDRLTMDKTRASIKDLYSRMLVTVRRTESISKRIDKLRDEELQPQIIELLQGLMETWKVMLESHEIQNKIMFEVKTFTCPTYGKFSNNTHRLATLQLEVEIQNWLECYLEYVEAHRAYIKTLNGWLSKFMVPEVGSYSRGRSSATPSKVNGPPLFLICHDWLVSLENLPDKSVASAIRSFGKDVRALWFQQGEEQHQKMKVDNISKEFDRKILAFQKAERRIFESKLSDNNSEQDIEHGAELLKERKDLLDSLRRKVDVEKQRHHDSIQETQRITLNGFQTGFCRIFESLTEFSRASVKMYDELVTTQEQYKKVEMPSQIEEGSAQVGEDGRENMEI